MDIKLKPLQLSTILLALYGLLFLGEFYMTASKVYLAFGILALFLAYGTGKANKIAILLALIFSGLEFLMAIFYLMAGAILYVIDAGMSFFIIHDIVGYIGSTSKEEGGEKGE
jgi:hypothetical protein